MANTYVTENLSGAAFSDGSTLSGTYTAEYNASGVLIEIINPTLNVTLNGVVTSFTSATVVTTTGSFELPAAAGSNTNYSKLFLDWSGETPTTLNITSGTAATTVMNAAGTTLSLSSTGTISGAADQLITTTITNAAFADSATLSGTWTGVYSSTGFLEAVDSSTFTVTGPGGTDTFTGLGTLPYADDPTASSFTSYEIHDLGHTGTGTYTSLYVDWKTETPSSFYEGSPSLYTSVKNTAVSATASIRLVSDGTTGNGSVPSISGLPPTQTGTDKTPSNPFSTVTVTDSDSTTTTSATITLSNNGIATNADGSLTAASGGHPDEGCRYAGTYSLSAVSPAALTTELRGLIFTPTVCQVAQGSTVLTKFDLSINDNDGSTSAPTTDTVTAVCFLGGAMIAIPDGEMPVEAFSICDLVLTADGRVMPVRDLLVSPEHAMFIDGLLIQAGALVNRVAIIREARMPKTFTYYHLELESHSLVLAEGAATETFVDNVHRMAFDNWAEHQALYGAVDAIPEMEHPRAKSARQIPAAVKRRLASRQALFTHELAAA